MSDLLDPAYEVTGHLVAVLRADQTLYDLLFSRTVPRVDASDTRVYQSQVQLPDEIASVLPRVLVEAVEAPFETEQDYSAIPQAVVTVWLHVMVEAEDRALGEKIMARLRVIAGSTSMNGPRILGSALVPTGVRAPQRETAFRNAWHFTREYRAPLVGVA